MIMMIIMVIIHTVLSPLKSSNSINREDVYVQSITFGLSAQMPASFIVFIKKNV